MNITVVFPKASCYYGKGLDTQRIYHGIFQRYIYMLKEAGCSFEYFLEDTLARDFLTKYGINDAKVISCLSKSDVDFFNNFRDLVDLPQYVYSEFQFVDNYAGDVEQKFMVPINLVREDKQQYINKRVEMYRKRIRTATESYLVNKKNVLMFRANNVMDRVPSLKDSIYVGDGKLRVEVDLNSKMAIVYYGGTYLQEEYLPTILSI